MLRHYLAKKLNRKRIRNLLEGRDWRSQLIRLFFPDVPGAATWEEWEKWHDSAQSKKPIRYFLSHDLPGHVSMFFKLWVSRPIWWIRYRTINQHHVIRPRTLTPGYVESDQLMIHGMFQILVDYVEIQCAALNSIGDEDSNAKRRDPEGGVKYLVWASSLDDPSLGIQNQNPGQAFVAKECLELYRWWVEERPQREDPDRILRIFSNCSGGSLLHVVDIMREEQTIEDKSQMKRLVDISPGLWT